MERASGMFLACLAGPLDLDTGLLAIPWSLLSELT